MFPKLEDNIIPNRLSKDVCNLIICGAIFNFNKPIWVCLRDYIIPKMMVFNGNVLGPRKNFGFTAIAMQD
jgi:hypothetical protein